MANKRDTRILDPKNQEKKNPIRAIQQALIFLVIKAMPEEGIVSEKTVSENR